MCNSWWLVLPIHGTSKKRAWHSGKFKICPSDCAMTQRDKEATVSHMPFGVMIYHHEVHWQDCSAPLYPRTVKKTFLGDWHALGSMSKGFLWVKEDGREKKETCSLTQYLETRKAHQPLAFVLWILELEISHEGIISEAETWVRNRRCQSLPRLFLGRQSGYVAQLSFFLS